MRFNKKNPVYSTGTIKYFNVTDDHRPLDIVNHCMPLKSYITRGLPLRFVRTVVIYQYSMVCVS